MTNQHTPGPWKFYQSGDHFYIDTPTTKQIAKVFDEDNARLIAAAPELLGALTTLNIYLPDILKTLSDDFKDHPIFELVKIAEKTIAKANGGKYETIQKD